MRYMDDLRWKSQVVANTVYWHLTDTVCTPIRVCRVVLLISWLIYLFYHISFASVEYCPFRIASHKNITFIRDRITSNTSTSASAWTIHRYKGARRHALDKRAWSYMLMSKAAGLLVNCRLATQYPMNIYATVVQARASNKRARTRSAAHVGGYLN